MRLRLLTPAVLALAAAATPATAQKEKDLKQVELAIATMTEKDSGMVKWFRESYGYAVFPNVGKGGMGIGAAHGNGIVYRGGTPVGKTALTQITVGLQLGGRITSYNVCYPKLLRAACADPARRGRDRAGDGRARRGLVWGRALRARLSVL